MTQLKSTQKKVRPHRNRARAQRGKDAPMRAARSKRKAMEVFDDRMGVVKARGRLSEPDDILECLNNSLSLVETVAIALREYEPHPGIGSICTALEQSVGFLARAHAAVDMYMQERRHG